VSLLFSQGARPDNLLVWATAAASRPTEPGRYSTRRGRPPAAEGSKDGQPVAAGHAPQMGKGGKGGGSP